jgi:hypothetical protein
MKMISLPAIFTAVSLVTAIAVGTVGVESRYAQRQEVADNRLLIRYAEYNTLLERKWRFEQAGQPVPPDLRRRLLEKCQQIRALGGAC